MNTYKWDSTALCYLMRKNEKEPIEVGRAINNYPYSRVEDFMCETSSPTLDELIALADYFSVSVDFLIGRNAPEMKAAYMEYATHAQEIKDAVKNEFTLSWPYNLVAELLGRPIDYELTEDHIEGIAHAISSALDARECRILHLRFRDEKTLADIAGEFGITRNRIDQICKRALRKLRNPARLRYIVYGYDFCEQYDFMAIKRDALESAIGQLKETEKTLADLENKVTGTKAKLFDAFAKELGLEIPEYQVSYRLKQPIEVLDLSVKAYNSLKRSGRNTIGDLVEMAEHDFVITRNLGQRCMDETIQKVFDYTGINIREKQNWK